MIDSPVPVRSYGGAGAWADAELDVALLASVGIQAAVEGDAHHHAPLFGGDQVRLVVATSDRDAANAFLEASLEDD
jgi:hypothetical protein